jgi:antitoxin CptB
VIAAASDSDEALAKRRLRWQCRRGMRELDLLLNDVVDRHYPQLCEQQRRDLERLLDYQDPVLLAWLMGQQQPTDPVLATLVTRIRQ